MIEDKTTKKTQVTVFRFGTSHFYNSWWLEDNWDGSHALIGQLVSLDESM